MYTNADCLTNKLLSLHESIEHHKPDIIAITEIKPKNLTLPLSASNFLIDNYQLFQNIDSQGRGIGIYIHNSLKASEIELKSSFQEYITLKINLAGKDSLGLTVIYRSPSSSDDNNATLISDLSLISNNNSSHQLILGDFNLKEINWENNTSTVSENHIASKFLDKTQDLFWYQHVQECTRFRTNNQPSRVDLIFTNEEGMIKEVEYQPPLWSNNAESDHLVLVFDFICYTESETDSTPRLDYKKADYDKLRTALKNNNWVEILSSDDVNKNLLTFMDIYNKEVQNCIPLKKTITRKTGNKPIWMNSVGLRKIKKKYNCWKRYLTTQEGIDYEFYKKTRNDTKNYLKKLLREFEEDIAKNIKNNPKSFWKYVNSKSKTKAGIHSLINKNGETIEDKNGKANILNEYFSSVFTKEENATIPQILPSIESKITFNFREISTEVIKKKLDKLKPSKSPGPDHCHPRIFKELIDEILIPLQIIFNQSINTSCVPNLWKQANITPIHKKGARNKPQNFRPVSLTSILCKLLESCLRDQLLEHMKSNKLFSNDQHGFLPNRSCITQLLLIIEHWTHLIDDGNNIDTLYLDFSKAFDSVPHNRLLLKLRKIGMSDSIVNWFKSYLENRTQRVCIEGIYSEWEKVTSGVPQGSVLGPILFLIYINDLPESINSFIKIFADDTKIYNTVNNITNQTILQKDIDNATEWANMWQLPFNAEKCKIMHIGRSNQNYNYTMVNASGVNKDLMVVNVEKDLGVIFNSNLSFKEHVNSSIGKGNQMLGIIKRNFTALDTNAFIQLYKSLVRSQLEYANVIWRPYLRADINNIEKVQRRATKYIGQLAHLPYEERLKAINLPTLEYRRARGDMIQTYKIMHKLEDLEPSDFFNLDISNRTRGHSLKIIKNRFHLDLRKYSFVNRIVNEWNGLPEDVVTAPSLNSFKNRLDKLWSDRRFIF